MNKKSAYAIYRTIMIILITAFTTFLITYTGIDIYNKNGGTLFKKGLAQEIISDIENYQTVIDKYYIGDIDENKLREGAIRGYIEALGDPYTEYISKEEMDEYLEETMGNYVGIGIYMMADEKTDTIKVLLPIPGSPAEAAGLQAGDIITAVDGKKYSSDELTDMSNNIKGGEGTEVTLDILRGEETLQFKIKRANVKLNPVQSKVLDSNIGYIKFISFDELTADDFKQKYEELKAQNIKSLIIDLRNNGGGLVDEATKIADYILEKDAVILYEVDKNGNEVAKKSEKDPIIDVPIIILTNENTASSSEILAGALKDLGKAKIVGTKTFGKGIIQEILSLKNGDGIKITTQEYLTPNHNKINEIGIEPDENVELSSDLEDEIDIPEEKDTQLQKAIEMLK